MFEFSSKTQVNKQFKINDILKQIKADKTIKADAKKINSIVLSNVINAKSINVKYEDDIFKEIYIFRINLNEKEIPNLFLEALDKSIRFHTYYVFSFNNEIYTTMCFKEIGKVVKLSEYYSHNFHASKIDALPIINSVSDVYKILYSYEVNIKSKETETPNDFFKRVNVIKKLKFYVSKIEKAIRLEVQPKKKFEYHSKLLEYKKELEELVKVEE